MRILLDTHILLSAITTPEPLAEAVHTAIIDPANDVLFSAASIWEIAIKASRRHDDFAARPEVVAGETRDIGFIELPVFAGAALRLAGLPPILRDRFDRLLVAQAIAEPAILYTADERLVGYSELVRRVAAR